MADYDTNIERKWKMHKHIVNTFSYNNRMFDALKHFDVSCERIGFIAFCIYTYAQLDG